MKKRFALCTLFAALAGCNSEYTFDEIATSYGALGTPEAHYVTIKSGEPLNGTVVPQEGGRVLQPFKVEDGKVVGEWKAYDDRGRLVEGQLQAGQFVGTKKTWCEGKSPSHVESVVTEENGRRSVKSYDCASGQQIADRTFLLDPDGKHPVRVGEQRDWQVIDGEQKLTLLETYAADGSGKLEGQVEHYNHKGVLMDRATYKAGKLDGVLESWTTFDGTTTVPGSKATYREGKKNGPAETYFVRGWPAGTIAQKGDYKDDRKVGRWVDYSQGSASVHDFDVSLDPSPMADRLVDAATGRPARFGAANTVQDLEGFAYLQKHSGIDINQRLTGEQRPLITFAADNAYDYLISAGADPQGRDLNGNTRLMTCLAPGNTNCGLDHMVMLTGKEDLKASNVYGYTPLALFCQRADDLARSDKAQTDALFQILLKGSDVNAKAYGGETALHACMTQRDHSYAQALVEAGANLDAADLNGIVPLAAAFLQRYPVGGFTQAHWSEDIIRFVASYQGKTPFTFDTPVPMFGKSVRQMVLENGDTTSARLIDSLVGSAQG